MEDRPPAALYLALDTASPVVSVAVGGAAGVRAETTFGLRSASELLLVRIEEILAAAGTPLGGLAGVVALAGPGSFTGLRIGLATALGLHQALGLPATALSTFEVLAATAPEGCGEVVAAVDALRGDWSVQRFGSAAGRPRPLSEPERLPSSELAGLAPGLLVGFGVSRLAGEPGRPEGLRALEPPPLAATALHLAAHPETAWDPARLTRPIYFRPPAVTRPRTERAS